jgi:rhodanese-related sulfurtransferase
MFGHGIPYKSRRSTTMFNFADLFKRDYNVLNMSKAQVNIENDSSIHVIDVRTPEEYRSGHIPGAVNVPLDRPEKITSVVKNMDEPVYVYCMSGSRSSAAANYFSRLGYTNVTNIGGIGGWRGKLKKN